MKSKILYEFHVNLFGQPFTRTWEEVAAAMEQFPRMMFELDGSWILSDGVGKDRWQIDGHLFDFNDCLHRVELHGQCPPAAFDKLLACFGWPEIDLIFEQVIEGLRLDEAEFRRVALAKYQSGLAAEKN